MKKFLCLFIVSLFLMSCSDSEVHYVVHFQNGDSVDVGYCLIAHQDVSWGNPTFVCDGQEYGNVTYVETVSK